MLGKFRIAIFVVVASLNLCLPEFACCQLKDTVQVRRIIALARKLSENYPDSMFNYAETGMKLATEIGDKNGVIDLLILRGIYFWSKSNYVLAIENYNAALDLSRTINKQTTICRSLSNLGQVYSKLGEYSRAIEYFLQSIALGDSIHADISTTYNSLGVAYKKNNNFDLAIKAFEETIHIIKSGGGGIAGLMGGVYTNLGSVYLKIGEKDRALDCQKMALHIFDSLQQPRGIAVCYNNISENLVEQKKFNEALIFSQKALDISREHGLPASETIALEGLASIASSTGKYEKAINYLLQASILSQAHQHREDLINIYSSLATCYEAMHQPEKALGYHRKFIQLKDSVFNQESSNKIANLRVTFEINKREKDLALLKNEREIAVLNRNISIAIATGIIIVLFVLALYQYTRIKRNKLMLSQREIIHQTRQKLMEVDMENQKLKHLDLEKEIEHKSRELTTHALNLLQKNQLLEEIKGGLAGLNDAAQPVLKQDIKKLVGSINLSHHQDKEWAIFKAHFEEVNQGFFETLVVNYPDLSGNDIKVCALAKLNLGSKEIASILGISVESAKMARYRLRKKLKLTASQNLVSFLSGF